VLDELEASRAPGEVDHPINTGKAKVHALSADAVALFGMRTMVSSFPLQIVLSLKA
jgi:hypothetical protein